MPRWIVGILVAAATLLVLVSGCLALVLGLAWHHYRTHPDFATWAAEHPVSERHADGLWIEAEGLDSGGVFDAGDVDPLALAPDDPDYERVELRFQAGLWHAEERLLELEQVATFALVRGSGERRGVALRTVRCETAPGFRARARIWVPDDAELVGPGSAGRGTLDFDVGLLSGEGEDRPEVVRRTQHGIGPLVPEASPGLRPRFFLGWIHPTLPAPEEGLVYRLRQRLGLTMTRTRAGSGGVSVSACEFSTNAGQFSHRFEAKVVDAGSSVSRRGHQLYTWNGRAW